MKHKQILNLSFRKVRFHETRWGFQTIWREWKQTKLFSLVSCIYTCLFVTCHWCNSECSKDDVKQWGLCRLHFLCRKMSVFCLNIYWCPDHWYLSSFRMKMQEVLNTLWHYEKGSGYTLTLTHVQWATKISVLKWIKLN